MCLSLNILYLMSKELKRAIKDLRTDDYIHPECVTINSVRIPGERVTWYLKVDGPMWIKKVYQIRDEWDRSEKKRLLLLKENERLIELLEKSRRHIKTLADDNEDLRDENDELRFQISRMMCRAKPRKKYYFP